MRELIVVLIQQGPIPMLTDYDRHKTLFWTLTGFAVVWWVYQLIKLPGTFNELQARFSDLGKGQSFLPLIMQMFFAFFWWIIPLIPIAYFWSRGYATYLQHIMR